MAQATLILRIIYKEHVRKRSMAKRKSRSEGLDDAVLLVHELEAAADFSQADRKIKVR